MGGTELQRLGLNFRVRVRLKFKFFKVSYSFNKIFKIPFLNTVISRIDLKARQLAAQEKDCTLIKHFIMRILALNLFIKFLDR